jgi:hypothetical protein
MLEDGLKELDAGQGIPLEDVRAHFRARNREYANTEPPSALTRAHAEATMERFKRDPAFAQAYITAVLKDGDESEMRQTLERLPGATRIKLGSLLAEFGESLGGIELDIERDKTPAEPHSFE